ncbi:MAG: serine/threonine-protein kinase [Phycisphaerae bacterium]|jgi:serine/threonine-protein kinase
MADFPDKPLPPDEASHPDSRELEAIAMGRSVDEAALLHAAECPGCQATIREIEANNRFLSQMMSAARSASATLPSSMAQLPSIPGYELLGEIHRGGQGVVFRARQIATKREVAIKLPLAGSFLTAKAKVRFEREIELVAQMHHPNIVTVHDSGLTPDGRYFIVMELIDGVTLDRFIASGSEQSTVTGRRRVEFILRLFARIAGAVQHAHARGVIHRDLKPGNVLVDAQGQPHVVDFGLARRGEWSPETSPTLVDEFQGTPAYASPEQVSGDPRAIDVRTDIYSLGVMLYRALTGHWPYAVEGSLSDQIRNIKHALPQAPSRRVRHVDPDVDTVVLTALAKEPQRRYQSAAALESDLNACLAGQPISARRAGVLYVVRKAAARHKAVTITAAAAVIALGASIYSWQMRRNAAVEIAEERARAQAAAASLSQRLLEQIAVAGGGAMQQGFARRVLDAAAADLDRGLATDRPLTHASLRAQLGRMYARLDQHSAALHQFQAGLAALGLAGADPDDLRSQLSIDMVGAQLALGRFSDAADSAKAAIDAADRSGPAGQTRAVAAHAELVAAALQAGTPADPETLKAAMSRARADLEAMPRAADAARAALLVELAKASMALGDPAAALRDAESAMALATVSGDASAAVNAGAVQARVYAMQGDFDACFRAIREQVGALSDQRYAWASKALVAAGDAPSQANVDAALTPVLVQHVDDLAAMLREVVGDDRPRAASLLVNAARGALRLRQGERAAELAGAGAGIMLGASGPGEPGRLEALRVAATGWSMAGGSVQEVATLREAVDAARAAKRPEPRTEIDLWTRLSRAAESCGDKDAAVDAATRAANLAALGGRSLTSLRLLFERAKLLERLGMGDAAMDAYQGCLFVASRRGEWQTWAEIQLHVARLREASGELGSAVAALIAGEAVLDRMQGLDPVMRHALCLNRVPVLAALGEDDAVGRMLGEAVAGASQTLGPGSSITRRLLECAVMWSESNGDRDRASAWRRMLHDSRDAAP